MNLADLSNEQKQYLIIGGVGAVVLAGVIFFGVKFSLSSMTDARAELDMLEEKIEKAEQSLKKHEKVRSDFFGSMYELEDRLSNLPPDRNYYSWATEIIYSTGRDTALEIDSVDELTTKDGVSQPKQGEFIFETYALRVTARGSYQELKRFIRKIEANQPLVRFAGLEISAGNDPTEHSIQLFMQWPFNLGAVVSSWETVRQQQQQAGVQPQSRPVPSVSSNVEADRLAAQKAEAERLATERAEVERLAAQQAEAERLAAQKAAAEKAEAERLAAERARAERLAAEKAEAERLAAQQAEAERLAAQKAAAEKAKAERLVAEKAEAERLAAQQAEAERLAAQKAAVEKAEAERLAAEKARAERLAAETAEAERLAAQQAEAERLAAQKAAAEKAEAERAAAALAEAERLAAERAAAEKAEAERLAAEKAETERLAAQQAEAERLAAQKAAAEKEESASPLSGVLAALGEGDTEPVEPETPSVQEAENDGQSQQDDSLAAYLETLAAARDERQKEGESSQKTADNPPAGAVPMAPAVKARPVSNPVNSRRILADLLRDEKPSEQKSLSSFLDGLVEGINE